MLLLGEFHCPVLSCFFRSLILAKLLTGYDPFSCSRKIWKGFMDDGQGCVSSQIFVLINCNKDMCMFSTL